MTEPVVLHSRFIGAVLRGLFWSLAVYLVVLFSLAGFMMVTGQTTGVPFSVALILLGLFQLGLLPLAILLIIWVVAFHLDLRRVFPDYPVSPLKAVLFMFIPILNFYGLWRVFGRISEFLRATGGEAGRLGDRANYWAVFGYISLGVGALLFQFSSDLTMGAPFGPGMSPWIFLVYSFLVTGFVFFYLNSIRLSQRSLALKAAEGVAFDPREVLSHMRP